MKSTFIISMTSISVTLQSTRQKLRASSCTRQSQMSTVPFWWYTRETQKRDYSVREDQLATTACRSI